MSTNAEITALLRAQQATDAYRRLTKWAAEFRVQWSNEQIRDLVLANARTKGASDDEIANIRTALVW